MPTATGAVGIPLLVGQSGSALGTSAGQDLAAVRGGHSFSEPMDFASLSLFGLISHFHDAVPLSLLLSVMELRFRLREGINPIVSQVVIIVRICARCQARIWFCLLFLPI